MARDEATYAERHAKAQEVTEYTIAGIDYPRVRYGDEQEDWGASHQNCHDCGVKPGEYHLPGCDVERCPVHPLSQSISCMLCEDEDEDDESEQEGGGDGA